MENNLIKMFEETDKIEVAEDNQCINCGALLANEYSTKCEICGYDSAEEFTCPYKIFKEVKLPNETISLGFCELNRKQCKVQGLDFEICSTFRSLDSFKED